MFFLKYPNKSIGALGLIRKCLNVSPSSRFTVDDIATYWWVNLGYKYPPVHYYLNPTWQKEGIMSSSNPQQTLPYNGTKLSEQRVKMATPPIPSTSQPPLPLIPALLPVTLPPPTIQNGRLTDTESKSKSKSKSKKNGRHHSIRSHRINDNTTVPVTTDNKNEPSNRWISNDKHNRGMSSKHAPPLHTTVY